MDISIEREEELRERLGEEAYLVLREKGTEAAYSGKYDNHFEKGEYRCKVCGQKLFDSNAKFDSGCGWPAFSDVVNNQNVTLLADNSHGMKRIEVRCAKCDSHLGHVFDDGPKEKGGKRYCINSVCLDFSSDS